MLSVRCTDASRSLRGFYSGWRWLAPIGGIWAWATGQSAAGLYGHVAAMPDKTGPRGPAVSDMLIRIDADAASDSWGFVGVARVGAVEAYRTLEAFASPELATTAMQPLVADVLGEFIAGREWRAVRDQRGATPTRQDFNFSALGRRAPQAD